MKKHLTSEGDLPFNGQYVLAHLTKNNWGDSDDPFGNRYFKVLKFQRGLSVADREALPDDYERKRTFSGADEDGNNRRPYNWNEFGPSTYFGQEVDCWYDLNDLGDS